MLRNHRRLYGKGLKVAVLFQRQAGMVVFPLVVLETLAVMQLEEIPDGKGRVLAQVVLVMRCQHRQRTEENLGFDRKASSPQEEEQQYPGNVPTHPTKVNKPILSGNCCDPAEPEFWPGNRDRPGPFRIVRGINVPGERSGCYKCGRMKLTLRENG